MRYLRRLPYLLVGGILVVAAFSTGYAFLFYLVYLGLLVVGGSYLVTRNGLADLEAGYAVNQLQAHVGDQLRTTYTLRNTSRLPKLWLEVHNPSTLPIPLPGRAISLGTRRERSWVARVPLIRRGHFRVDPLQIRTGDPVRVLRGERVGRAWRDARRVPTGGIDPALAPPGGEPGRQPIDARAGPADDTARHLDPALRAG